MRAGSRTVCTGNQCSLSGADLKYLSVPNEMHGQVSENANTHIGNHLAFLARGIRFAYLLKE